MSGRPLPFIGSREPWQSGPVTGHAHCILAPNPSPYTLDGTNTWLLHSSAGAIVVDPGPDHPGHRAAVLAAAEELDAPIRLIVLTHGHIDHAEGASAMAADLRADVRAVDPLHRLGAEGLVDGDVIAVGDVEVRVVATPGHSGDSVSLLLPVDEAVITGDTVLGRGTTVIAWPDGDLSAYLASLARLRDLVGAAGVATLLPGHGPRLKEPGSVLDAYLEHRRLRLEIVREVLATGVADEEQILDLVYADTPAQNWPAALQSLRAQLAYLRG